jgi:hypothetical protein
MGSREAVVHQSFGIHLQDSRMKRPEILLSETLSQLKPKNLQN